MDSWDGSNRRESKRISYPCLIVLVNDKTGKKESILTHTENISKRGIGVIIKQDIPDDVKIDVEIDLLDLEHHLKCSGVVAWKKQRKQESKKKPLYYDMGIEFTDVSDEFLQRIEKIQKHFNK